MTKRGLDASNAVYSKKAPGRIMMGQHMDKKHTRGGDGMTDMQATKSTEDNKASIGASENGVGTEVPMSYAFVAQPFVLGTEKSRILKPLEEAAEVFGAWQEMDKNPCKMRRSDVIYECCDTIQAVANALASLGVTQDEVDRTFTKVHEYNAERGRYGSSKA